IERSVLPPELTVELGYPVIIGTGESAPIITETDPSGRELKVRIEPLEDDDQALAAMLAEQLSDGGCAVVIRNTVRRAQATARYLAGQFGDLAVTVAHAQFLATDRVDKDADL